MGASLSQSPSLASPPRASGSAPSSPAPIDDRDATSWRELYPFESRHLSLDGLRYHYLDEGRGPTLLCVHGNPTWSFYWRRIVSEFRATHRVIAVDHVGCGLSGKPQTYDYSLARHIHNLRTLIQTLDLRDVTLLAHDWGGAIGLGAVVDEPERFSRLVLFNTAGYRSREIPLRIAACRWPLVGPFMVRGFNAFAGAAIVMATSKPERFTPAVTAGYLAPYDSWANRVAIQRFVEDIPLSPSHPTFGRLQEIELALPSLGLPTKLIWGMRDWCFTPRFLERFEREFFPHASSHRFHDAGHYVVEDAHERIVPLLRDFLQKPGGRQERYVRPRAIPPAIAAPDRIPAPPARTTADGRPLVNIARRLALTAEATPDAIAVAFPLGRDQHGRREYRKVTYRELNETVDRLVRGLRRRGLKPGTRIALMVRPSVEFVALSFALFRAGAVAVLIDPGMGGPKLVDCLQQVRPAGFVAAPVVHAIRSLLSQRFPDATFNVSVGGRSFLDGDSINYDDLLGEPWSPVPESETAADDPAAIIFTTGSTGPPKGVLYRHGNFDAQVEQIRDRYDVRPGEVNLPGFPLFTLFDAAMGVTTVVPDMDPTRPARVDPAKIVEAINDWSATQAFGSPAIWNRVGKWCVKHGVRLKTLKRVLSAGAPVPARVLRMIQGVIHPDGAIHTPYGATEALPVASISNREVLSETAGRTRLGAGTCVGEKFSGIDWKVVRIVDGPIATLADAVELPPGEIGELIVAGPVVTDRYETSAAATTLGKIRDGSRVWHRMGDSGWLDDRGRFWFCGRVAHRVQTTDGTLFTDRVEPIFDEHPDVFRSALVGVGAVPNQTPVLIVEPHAGRAPRTAAERKKLFEELARIASEHETTRPIRTFLVKRGFPVDVRHNAKIFREKLAVWAAEKLGTARPS